MARICQSCGKGPRFGHAVSHAHNLSQKVWLPNLQKVRVVEENGRRRRLRVCTRCLRKGVIQKAVS